MPFVGPERIAFALSHLSSNDGFLFEEFANEFLVGEFPTLRPVGGIHDGGVDAYVYHPADEPETYIQMSVTRAWDGKIRSTITTLRKNGHQVRTLIYCSPWPIAKDTVAIKKELRADGISLDIRDEGYFVSFTNSHPSCQAAAERLARRIVDPLLPQAVTDDVSLVTSDEQKLAVAFLQIAVTERAEENAAKALTKFSYDTLVQYALRETLPDAPMHRDDLMVAIRRLASGGDQSRFSVLATSAIDRLVSRDIVKHHTKDDAFVLENSRRQAIRAKLIARALDNEALRKEIVERVRSIAADIQIDFSLDESAIANDALTICDSLFVSQAEVTARALANQTSFFPSGAGSTDIIEKLYRDNRLTAAAALTRDQILDVLCPLVEALIQAPSEHMRRRFRAAIDAYCVLFVLRETPDVQAALDKVLWNGTVIADANIIVPCMAETLLPKGERRMTSLLLAAARAGMQLVVTDDVIEELETHLYRMRYTYGLRQHRSGPDAGVFGISEPILIRTFEAAIRSGHKGSFHDFIERFVGPNFPRQDLAEFLLSELQIRHEPFVDALATIPPEQLHEVFELWCNAKTRRPWMNESNYEKLVMHDARTLLLTEHLRADASLSSNVSAASWWWLTLDRTAHRIDAKRRAADSTRRPRCCMSPDFFVTFLSLRPKVINENVFHDTLPISVEMASLDLVPRELSEKALEVLASAASEPVYLRRRRLRDLVYGARAMRGEVLAGGIEDLTSEIEESLLRTSGQEKVAIPPAPAEEPSPDE